MRREPPFAPALLLILGGFIIWALHFLFIYGFTGLACERPGWADMLVTQFSLVPFVVALGTIVALVLLLVLVLSSGVFGRWRDNQPVTEPAFLRHLALGAAALGGVAILWEGLFTVFLVPGCF